MHHGMVTNCHLRHYTMKVPNAEKMGNLLPRRNSGFASATRARPDPLPSSLRIVLTKILIVSTFIHQAGSLVWKNGECLETPLRSYNADIVQSKVMQKRLVAGQLS